MKKRIPPLPYGADGEADLFSVASATECTGLMPAAPADESEVLSYEELYDIPQSKHRTDRPVQKVNPNK